jgi:hypothetical protein
MTQRSCAITFALMLMLSASKLVAAFDGPIRLLTRSWQPAVASSPEVDMALDLALADLARFDGVETEHRRFGELDYERELVMSFRTDVQPDLIWVAPTDVELLVEQGQILPLDDLAQQHPELLETPEPEVLDLYRVGDELYAIPLGTGGELAAAGWSVTVAAGGRGAANAAVDLVARLRQRVPRRGFPDLMVEELAIEPEVPEEGQTFITRAWIANLGEEPASVIGVDLMLNDEPLAEGIVELLEPGQSAEVSFDLMAPRGGIHQLQMIIDGDNVVAEANELNNNGWLQLLASPKPTGPPEAPKPQGSAIVLDSAAYKTNVMGMYPRVAFAGSNYLVVWAKQTPLDASKYNHRLIGTRITPTGTVLDSPPIVIAPEVTKYNSFNIAYNGSVYLVVWEQKAKVADPQTVINARRVAKNGSLLDTTPIVVENIPLGSGPWCMPQHEEPEVAALANGAFMVVYNTTANWSDPADKPSQAGVYARIVKANGTVMSGRTKLYATTNLRVPYYRLNLAYQASRHEGFLTFTSYGTFSGKSTGAISGMWIKDSGTTLTASTPFELFVDPTPNDNKYMDLPAVAATGYEAVWQSSVGKTTTFPDIHGSRIGVWGGSATLNTKIVTGYSERYPEATRDGSNALVVLSHYQGCQRYVAAVLVNEYGQAGAITVLKASTTESVWGSDVAVGTTNALIVYEQSPLGACGSPTPTTQILCRFIDRSS